MRTLQRGKLIRPSMYVFSGLTGGTHGLHVASPVSQIHTSRARMLRIAFPEPVGPRPRCKLSCALALALPRASPSSHVPQLPTAALFLLLLFRNQEHGEGERGRADGLRYLDRNRSAGAGAGRCALRASALCPLAVCCDGMVRRQRAQPKNPWRDSRWGAGWVGGKGIDDSALRLTAEFLCLLSLVLILVVLARLRLRLLGGSMSGAGGEGCSRPPPPQE